MEFRIAIFISGNGSNMLNIINACKNNILESEVLVVVADNDKAAGINFAKQKKVDTFVIKLINDLLISIVFSSMCLDEDGNRNSS